MTTVARTDNTSCMQPIYDFHNDGADNLGSIGKCLRIENNDNCVLKIVKLATILFTAIANIIGRLFDCCCKSNLQTSSAPSPSSATPVPIPTTGQMSGSATETISETLPPLIPISSLTGQASDTAAATSDVATPALSPKATQTLRETPPPPKKQRRQHTETGKPPVKKQLFPENTQQPPPRAITPSSVQKIDSPSTKSSDVLQPAPSPKATTGENSALPENSTTLSSPPISEEKGLDAKEAQQPQPINESKAAEEPKSKVEESIVAVEQKKEVKTSSPKSVQQPAQESLPESINKADASKSKAAEEETTLRREEGDEIVVIKDPSSENTKSSPVVTSKEAAVASIRSKFLLSLETGLTEIDETEGDEGEVSSAEGDEGDEDDITLEGGNNETAMELAKSQRSSDKAIDTIETPIADKEGESKPLPASLAITEEGVQKSAQPTNDSIEPAEKAVSVKIGSPKNAEEILAPQTTALIEAPLVIDEVSKPIEKNSAAADESSKPISEENAEKVASPSNKTSKSTEETAIAVKQSLEKSELAFNELLQQIQPLNEMATTTPQINADKEEPIKVEPKQQEGTPKQGKPEATLTATPLQDEPQRVVVKAVQEYTKKIAPPRQTLQRGQRFRDQAPLASNVAAPTTTDPKSGQGRGVPIGLRFQGRGRGRATN